MKTESILSQSEIEEIKHLFSTDGSEVEARPCNLLHTTWEFQSPNGQLYLKTSRFLNQLIIGSVEFTAQRKGYGSKLLNILEGVAKRNNLTTLVAESVVSVEGREFCIKHGFTPEEIHGILLQIKENKGDDFLDRSYFKSI